MMVYRPTVRYSDIYKQYVDDIFKATTLDRNQVIRLALFTAAHSDHFKNILEKYKLGDVPLPSPDWGLNEQGYWKEQNYTKKETPLIDSEKKFINTGGIKIIIG